MEFVKSLKLIKQKFHSFTLKFLFLSIDSNVLIFAKIKIKPKKHAWYILYKQVILLFYVQTIKNYDKMIVQKLKSKIANRKCNKYF